MCRRATRLRRYDHGLVEAAHREGALFSINHPFDSCIACAWEHAIPADLDGLEIWNGEKGPQDQAIAMWDRLLRAGRRVTAVGGSDWHRAPASIGAASVRVFAAELSQPAILDAIRRHAVIVMRDSRIAAPSIEARCGSNEAGIGGTLTCPRTKRLPSTSRCRIYADGGVDFIWNAAA